MSRVQVRGTIEIYEIGGEETGYGTHKLEISSHPIRNTFVGLRFRRGKTITVVGKDLILAIQNAMNVGD